MANINLLDVRRKQTLKKQARIAKINYSAMALLMVSLLVMTISYGVYYWLNAEYSRVAAATEVKRKQYSAQKDLLLDIYTASTTLDEVSGLLDRKDRFEDKFKLYLDIYGKGIQVKQAIFSLLDQNEMAVAGEVPDLARYTVLFDYLDDLGKNKGFRKAMIDSLSKLDDGRYRFNYVFDVGVASSSSTPKGG